MKPKKLVHTFASIWTGSENSKRNGSSSVFPCLLTLSIEWGWDIVVQTTQKISFFFHTRDLLQNNQGNRQLKNIIIIHLLSNANLTRQWSSSSAECSENGVRGRLFGWTRYAEHSQPCQTSVRILCRLFSGSLWYFTQHPGTRCVFIVTNRDELWQPLCCATNKYAEVKAAELYFAKIITFSRVTGSTTNSNIGKSWPQSSQVGMLPCFCACQQRRHCSKNEAVAKSEALSFQIWPTLPLGNSIRGKWWWMHNVNSQQKEGKIEMIVKDPKRSCRNILKPIPGKVPATISYSVFETKEVEGSDSESHSASGRISDEEGGDESKERSEVGTPILND